ncbi:MAG: hypothetical protein QM736_29735 [Vicinamibacterales bacterium]
MGGREMFGQSGASAHGSFERETFVDGMDLNQYGGTYYVDSFSFEELNMQTANVPAERSTGGVVWNFVTKTGTNTFRGTGMFSGMTHGCCESNNISPEQRAVLLAGVPAYALAANPNPRLGSSVEHMFDLGGTFSGPIVKNRLWFAASGKVGEVYTRRVGSYNADGRSCSATTSCVSRARRSRLRSTTRTSCTTTSPGFTRDAITSPAARTSPSSSRRK